MCFVIMFYFGEVWKNYTYVLQDYFPGTGDIIGYIGNCFYDKIRIILSTPDNKYMWPVLIVEYF